MSIAANILLIVLELIALYNAPYKHDLLKTIIFYTQISNFIALISSVLYLFLSDRVAVVRYLATCMLTMTFFVTLCILVPMGGGFKKLMLGKTGLFLHTLCPILSFISYVFWESHSHAWYIPIFVTLIYGLIMVYLNAVKKVDGPYPFFRVHNQSKLATVVWIITLMLAVAIISFGISLLTT